MGGENVSKSDDVILVRSPILEPTVIKRRNRFVNLAQGGKIGLEMRWMETEVKMPGMCVNGRCSVLC